MIHQAYIVLTYFSSVALVAYVVLLFTMICRHDLAMPPHRRAFNNALGISSIVGLASGIAGWPTDRTAYELLHIALSAYSIVYAVYMSRPAFQRKASSKEEH